MFLHRTFLLLFSFVSISLTLAASPEYNVSGKDTASERTIIVHDILISGNKKTSSEIILREIVFKKGDTLSTDKLDELLRVSIENIVKTSLFHNTDIVFNQKDSVNTFLVTVTERWYWWVWPLLENPDRNFNDWAQHKDITRLSAGLHFQHENMRGKMEKLNLRVLGGYRTYLAGNYEWPYINKRKTIGLGLFAAYFTKYEINYATVDNEQVFYHGDQVMLRMYNFAIYSRYRPGNHITHIFALQHSQATINDSIRKLNPEFLFSAEKYKLINLIYSIKADYRDNRNYPLKGYYAEAEAGFMQNLKSSYNQQTIRASVRGYKALAKNLYTASEIAVRFTAPEVKPYVLQNALGFEREFVRGYEYMVIEAPHYWLFKSHIRYALLPSGKIRLPIIKTEKFNPVPLSIYLGPHLDLGQAFPALNPETNSLQGKLLTGYGLGLDFVTFYDKVVRIEYTFRHTGKGGLFIHFMAMI